MKEIIKAKKTKIYQDLQTILGDEIDAKFYNWAKKLLVENNPTQILAALLSYTFVEELNPDNYGEIQDVGARGKQLDQQGKARLFVALGKKDKMTPQKLVKLILERVPVKPMLISDVQVMDKFSFVTVPFEKANKIVSSFKEKGCKPLITMAKGVNEKKSQRTKERKR